MNPIHCAIVLCRPEESRNVGSVCRAMKNMGIVDLRIVADRASLDEAQVRTLAVHAIDVWDSARFFPPSVDGLRDALADCAVSGGTTRRLGQKRKSWGMTPEEFAGFHARAGGGTTAVVFGNERTGLTDEELELCSVAVNIPSSEDCPSLNLSHAVQIMSYAIFRATDSRLRGYEPIDAARRAALVSSISDHLTRVGLFKFAGKDGNERFLDGLFARAAVSEGEAARLERLFRRIAHIKTAGARCE
ncbi:MAG TPA: RNA methyltransferase [Treponemataceae bacterium]|nr:RNA methyltransferase [Treponemataceae bacterium]